MNNVFKTFQELLEFIELHSVTDETDYDAGGQPYGTRTKHFSYLIDKAREELGELAQLPYPPSAEVVALFGKKELPVAMSSLPYPPLKEEE